MFVLSVVHASGDRQQREIPSETDLRLKRLFRFEIPVSDKVRGLRVEIGERRWAISLARAQQRVEDNL